MKHGRGEREAFCGPLHMFDYSEIDRASLEGFAAFASGARFPAWVLHELVLGDAWTLGRRQAAEKANTATY